MQFMIFFNGQFWVGLIERTDDNQLFSSIHTFGEEPLDGQIIDFVNNDLYKMIVSQTASVENEIKELKKLNPKRLKKLAAEEMKKSPVSSKSQEAIQKQLEENKKERKQVLKEEKELIKAYKREKAVEKKKNKHRGK